MVVPKVVGKVAMLTKSVELMRIWLRQQTTPRPKSEVREG